MASGSVLEENVSVYLIRLLKDTKLCEWQRSLRQMTTSYYTHSEVKQAIVFLLSNIHMASQAIQDPNSFPGFPCLCLDIEKKPVLFDIDLWKTILIALNFELTEPEGNRHLDLIEVKVTNKVTLPVLEGFRILLENIIDLTWDSLRMILSLTENEAHCFYKTLQRLRSTSRDIKDQSCISNLLARQPEAMARIGFHKAHRREIMWEECDQKQLACVQVSVFGLYHSSHGLETYI